MLNTILLADTFGDMIGTAGCYIYSLVIAGGIIFCMAKYLKPTEK